MRIAGLEHAAGGRSDACLKMSMFKCLAYIHVVFCVE